MVIIISSNIHFEVLTNFYFCVYYECAHEHIINAEWLSGRARLPRRGRGLNPVSRLKEKNLWKHSFLFFCV